MKFKKIISALLACAVVGGALPLSETVMSSYAVSDSLLGDVNFDGIIDAIDAAMILNEYAKLSVGGVSGFNEEQRNAADVNADGYINAVDSSIVLYYYAHMQVGGTESFDDIINNIFNDSGTSVLQADNGFTETEIYLSSHKPKLSASKITLTESEARAYAETNEPLEVSLSVSGADSALSTLGIHFCYDDRLTLVDRKVETNLGFFDMVTCEAYESSVFLAAASCSDHQGQDGQIVTFKFYLPAYVNAGDVFPLDLRYEPGDLFTDIFNDKTGKVMQAWLFTKGLDDGYIEIVEDPVETVYGDADLSGDIEIADAVKIMCYVTDPENNPIEPQGITNGDVYQTGDGLSVQDALSIQKYLAQIITELPEK